MRGGGGGGVQESSELVTDGISTVSPVVDGTLEATPGDFTL